MNLKLGVFNFGQKAKEFCRTLKALKKVSRIRKGHTFWIQEGYIIWRVQANLFLKYTLLRPPDSKYQTKNFTPSGKIRFFTHAIEIGVLFSVLCFSCELVEYWNTFLWSFQGLFRSILIPFRVNFCHYLTKFLHILNAKFWSFLSFFDTFMQ